MRMIINSTTPTSANPPASLWSPCSWQGFEALQQPHYHGGPTLDQTLNSLRQLPPLVTSQEIDRLKEQITLAQKGQHFLIQGGDCAERFDHCTPETIKIKIKILMQMGMVISMISGKSVTRIGRIAGQYAKPRTDGFETIDGLELPIFRGDSINSFTPDAKSRRHDPGRLLQSHHYASMSLNYIRALMSSDFSNIFETEQWDLSTFAPTSAYQRYQKLIAELANALKMVEKLAGFQKHSLHDGSFYTSHEGLILDYEQAMTVKEGSSHFNLGAHFLWIGERTRQIKGAHVEYFRGISNPIGIKISPKISPQELLELLEVLNPKNESGRIILITRLGRGMAPKILPGLIKVVKQHQQKVLWSCDPMHGNTTRRDGYKTRIFEDIRSELSETVKTHQEHQSFLGGVHFEMTGENVTECMGGASNVRAQDLSRDYHTYCDPRLNYSQSLEIAFLMGELLKKSPSR